MSVESGARDAQPVDNGATPIASAAAAVAASSTNGTTTASEETPAAAPAGGAKKEPILTPAPLPAKSPWKSVSTDIPVSSIPVDSLESAKKNKPRSTNAGSVKSSSSTKWVPMKASIVVSGSKKPGNGKKNSVKGGQAQGPGSSKSNNGAPKKKKQPGQQAQKRQQQPQTLQGQHAPLLQQQQQGEQPLLMQQGQGTSSIDTGVSVTPVDNEPTTITHEREVKGKVKGFGSDDEDAKTTMPEGSQQNRENFTKHAEGGEHHYRKQHNYNNQHHPRQQGGFQRRRYYSNFNHSHNNNYINEAYKNAQGFQHHHQKGPHPSYHGGMGRPFNHHFRPRYPGPHQQQTLPPMYQQQFHPMQAIMVAVNSVARQMEYYFSPENLQRDEYLRSKLSKDGYAPAAMIAKFYRVNNMSFGGDPYLILASLREIVASGQSTVDIATGSLVKSDVESNAQDEESPLSRYFIRSKNWSNWLPEEVSTEVAIEKVLEGDELEEYLIAPVPIPPVYAPGAAPTHVPAPIPAPIPASIPATTQNAEEQKDEEKN